MAHDHSHDHRHDHGHEHSHGDDHHHHHHSHSGHHEWHSKDYVSGWIARDLERQGDRQRIIERLIAAIPFPRDSAIAVLDVGGGSGVLTDAVLTAFPRAQLTLQDFSQPMLDSARERFAARAGQVRYVQADLRDPLMGAKRRWAIRSRSFRHRDSQPARSCGDRWLLRDGAWFVEKRRMLS